MALLGQIMEMLAFERMTRRMGMTAEPYLSTAPTCPAWMYSAAADVVRLGYRDAPRHPLEGEHLHDLPEQRQVPRLPVSRRGTRRCSARSWRCSRLERDATRRIGMTAEPYHVGRGGAYIRAGQVLGAVGATGAALSGTPLVPGGRARRLVAAVSGAALLGASAATRWGVFHAGIASARDPKYTVLPQRQRLAERGVPVG